MKSILLVLICALVVWSARAQEPPARNSVFLSSQNDPPLLLVDSLPSSLNLLLLSPNKIERMDVFKGAEALTRFGDKGKNGVILIQTKPKTQLLRIPEILDQFHIDRQDRLLRICINNILIQKPEWIIAGTEDIESVEVVKGRYTDDLKEAHSDERFINIKPRHTLQN